MVRTKKTPTTSIKPLQNPMIVDHYQTQIGDFLTPKTLPFANLYPKSPCARSSQLTQATSGTGFPNCLGHGLGLCMQESTFRQCGAKPKAKKTLSFETHHIFQRSLFQLSMNMVPIIDNNVISSHMLPESKTHQHNQ